VYNYGASLYEYDNEGKLIIHSIKYMREGFKDEEYEFEYNNIPAPFKHVNIPKWLAIHLSLTTHNLEFTLLYNKCISQNKSLNDVNILTYTTNDRGYPHIINGGWENDGEPSKIEIIYKEIKK